ncbi:MAG TPA: hypothetical protein VGO55_09190 [Allosphingosinicella sp.]|jgi:hypothetical protein|nr:hypothetical protein [Allosphingosinicella sp.]
MMLVIGNFSNTHRVRRIDATKAEEVKEHLVHIPDFHTGHLGLVRDKSVLLTGPMPQDDQGEIDKRTCEIVATPHIINGDILKLNCTFNEAKHVLEWLVNLLSNLNVNIMNLESASLFEGKHHVVNMVLDMSRSRLSRNPITAAERAKFIDILPNLRLSNRRGLELFLHIVSQCHNILTWKPGPGGFSRQVPEVYISEFDRYEWTGQTSRASIERAEVCYQTSVKDKLDDSAAAKRNRKTFFQLLDVKQERIETLLGIDEGEPLDYLLLSDTESRSLRVQFFQSEHRKQIFEIGFSHRDEIGALYTILRTVAHSGFNVLSCLIREVKEYRNVWEAVLEYQGKRDLPSPTMDRRHAIRGLLEDSVDKYRRDIAAYDIGIFIPAHLPDAKKASGPTEKIPLDPAAPPDRQKPRRPKRLKADTHGPVERDWLITYANDMLFKGPNIFISSSVLKPGYRDILAQRLLEDRWEVSFYGDNAQMEATYTEARRLVADADYFVGIWTPDEDSESQDPTQNGKAGKKKGANGTNQVHTSPWMHFELGQAVAFEREFKILASKRLLVKDVVRRIAADKPVFRFEEDSSHPSDEASNYKHFDDQVDALLKYMNLNWRNGRYSRRPKRGADDADAGQKNVKNVAPRSPPNQS